MQIENTIYKPQEANFGNSLFLLHWKLCYILNFLEHKNLWFSLAQCYAAFQRIPVARTAVPTHVPSDMYSAHFIAYDTLSRQERKGVCGVSSLNQSLIKERGRHISFSCNNTLSYHITWCDKRLLISSCLLSVLPYGTTPLPLDGFLRNLIFEYF